MAKRKYDYLTKIGLVKAFDTVLISIKTDDETCTISALSDSIQVESGEYYYSDNNIIGEI